MISKFGKCDLILALALLAIIPLTSGSAAEAPRPAATAPAIGIRASRDPAVIERGRYLVRHVAVCEQCHSEKNAARGPTGEVDLSGRAVTSLPTPNITPARTGIGAFTDEQLARALRSNVGHDGRTLAIMNFNFADDDLRAVISYLRSMRPVERELPRKTFGMPNIANGRPPALEVSPRGTDVETGRYLVEAVADCGGCHTLRDFATGQMTQAPFGGGVPIQDEYDPTRVYWSANLTTGGRLATFAENDFVSRFRMGLLIDGSPMPWEAYKSLPESDIRAIYRYLKSLPRADTPARPPLEIKPRQ